MMSHFCGEWISIHSAWKASLDVFSITVYFKDSLIYKPTSPDARGVGVYSKIYPGMFGLKSQVFSTDYFGFTNSYNTEIKVQFI